MISLKNAVLVEALRYCGNKGKCEECKQLDHKQCQEHLHLEAAEAINALTVRAEKAEADRDNYIKIYQDICDKHQEAHRKMKDAFDKAIARAEKAEQERDAAVEDMRTCAYDENSDENHGACMCNFCARALNCPEDHRDPEEMETRCDFNWRGQEARKE